METKRNSYRAIICAELGTPDVLRITRLPQPTLSPSDVRVHIVAAGVNFPDVLMVAGEYQFKPVLPFVPGMESAGMVIETGASVKHFRPGDRVIVRQRTGAFAEQAVVPESMLNKLPETLSFEEGASFLIAFTTALHALRTRANLQTQEHVLITGAGGGVGLAAVAVAAHLGAKVVAAATSFEKREAARTAGATHVIDSNAEHFAALVQELTEGRGANVIYDPVGLPPLMLLRAAAFGARILIIGFAGGKIHDWPANRILLKCASLIGVRAGEWSRHFTDVKSDETALLLKLAGEGALRPYVSQLFPLEHAPDALRALANREAIGRVVVLP